MKKILFIALLFIIKQVNAQCSVTVSSDTTICSGDTITLTASGATSYTWMPMGANTATISVRPNSTKTYTVIAATGTCTATNMVTVSVTPTPTMTVISPPPVCAGGMVASPTISTQPFVGGANGVIVAWTCPCATSIGLSPSSGTIQLHDTLKHTTNTLTFTTPSASSTLITCVMTFMPTYNGCAGLPVNDTVTVYPKPTINITTDSTILCAGDTAILTASGANTYTWSTTETGINILISPTVSSDYTVTGTNINGCENTAAITQTVTTCNFAGIKQITNDNKQIKIYPNPSNGNFQVAYTDNIDELKVSDVLGQVVYEAKPNTTKTLITIDNTGVYFITLTSGTSISIKKIIVE